MDGTKTLTHFKDSIQFFKAIAKHQHCQHNEIQDLSGFGCTNIVCMVCESHVYESENVKLRFFSKQQWNNWVNDLTV